MRALLFAAASLAVVLLAYGEISRTVVAGNCYYYDNEIVQVLKVEESGVVWKTLKQTNNRNLYSVWYMAKDEFVSQTHLTKCLDHDEKSR